MATSAGSSSKAKPFCYLNHKDGISLLTRSLAANNHRPIIDGENKCQPKVRVVRRQNRFKVPEAVADQQLAIRFVQPLANWRNLGVDSAMLSFAFQQLSVGARIAFILLCRMRVRHESHMLRIERKGNGKVVFKVSGQLNAENVAEMGKLLEAEKKGSRIALDLTDLRSVDGEAVRFLEKCETDTIKLKNCGLYIREWIRRQRMERQSVKSSEA